MNEDYPFTSIFIPTMNRKSDLLECLASLQKIDYPKNRMELLIWDNGSSDGSAEAVKLKFKEMYREGWANLQLIESNINLGSYVPYNRFLLKTNDKSQYIFGLDDDVVVSENCLKNLLKVFKLETSAAVVGAKIIHYDNPSKIAESAGFINWWFGKFKPLQSYEKLVECDYVIGCGWLINREVLNEVGGFDEDYFLFHWEMDFCSGVQKHGYKIFYQPEAIIRHKIPPKAKRDGLYLLYRNKLILIKKNATFLQKLTSLTLYSFLWPPKIILDSLVVNKGINAKEVKIILKAVYHGIIGKTVKEDTL
ncbi:MAG: glycosyltransferase family 2 protein [Thermodesulfobacteriota bacterium]